MNKKKWLSPLPKTCDICNKVLENYFIDGRTVGGYWALMCTECHTGKGKGLGIGNGQKYLVDSGLGVDGFDLFPKKNSKLS